MTAFDTHKNFAIGTVLSAPADASGETFVLMLGDGQAFAANMPVTLCPPNVQSTGDNSEIGYLRSVTGDVLTITRAQEGTLPMQVAADWVVIGTVTAKTLADIESAVTLSGGVSDHGVLAGLSDDDHVQYHTDARGDVRYYTKGQVDTALSTKATASHMHTASQVTDFDTEVSNNTDVTANTAARHMHSNSAVLSATTASYTTAEAMKLAGVATGATANDTDTSLRARSSHTGTQSADTVTDGTTNKAYTAAEKTKLGAISGTNTGDETTALIKSKLSITTLSGANTGDQDLSSYATTAALTSGLAGKTETASYRATGSTLNRWYSSQVTNTAMTTGTPTIDIIRVMPVNITRATTIEQLAVNVTTAAAGSSARIGVYADNGNLYPSSLVVDGGALDTTTTGVKTVAVSTTLQPGLYWLAFNSGVLAPQIRCLGTNGTPAILGMDSTLGTAWGVGWSVASIFGALPSTFPTGGTVINATPYPGVFFRASA